jgi:hypothetical protein
MLAVTDIATRWPEPACLNHCAHVERGRRCLANNAVSVPKPGPVKSLIVVGAIKPTIYPARIVVAIDAGPIVVGIKSKVSPA